MTAQYTRIQALNATDAGQWLIPSHGPQYYIKTFPNTNEALWVLRKDYGPRW